MKGSLFLILIWILSFNPNLTNQDNENQLAFPIVTQAYLTRNSSTVKSCIDCHGNLFERKVNHPSKNNCEDCHRSNGKKHPQDDIKGFVLSEKMPILCFNCHDLIKKKSLLHKAANGSGCLSCHDAHQSDYPKLLLSDEKKLCLNCHNKTISTGTKKISSIKQLLKKGNFIHSAIDSGCSICHNPHGSMKILRLVNHFSDEEYVNASVDSFALCFSCHDSKLFKEPFTKTVTNFRNGDQNLHFLHVNRKKGRNCSICHNVHGSPNEFLINEKVQFGNWEMPIKFVKLKNGGSCFPGCHSEKKYDRFGITKVDSLFGTWSNKRSEKYIDSINHFGIINDKQIKESDSLKFSDIKFEFATTQIVKGTDNELINVINFMKEYPDCSIKIQGYTDNVGENAINKVLSQQRAEKVKQLMVAQGISYNRISTIGYGKSHPIAPNDTEKSRSKNRRVEIMLVKCFF